MAVTRSQAIKNWLNLESRSDLAARYHLGMEVQVLINPGNLDQRIEKEYKGRKYTRYTDGLQEWGPYRIPRNANTVPEYTDIQQTWSFEQHLKAIGMTGWNWQERISIYVGFDFDSITSHAQGFTETELNDVLESALKLDYITARYSTSGSGFHLEIKLDNVSTATHTEHAALARSLLGKMCTDTGYDFSAKVDACGGNLWVWHEKMKDTDGLKLIKKGNTLKDIPINWRDHLSVIKGNRNKAKPAFIKTDTQETLFDKLISEKPKIKIDAEHKLLYKYLNEIGAMWDTVDDQILICHTYDLKLIHDKYGMRGIFDTVAKGTEHGADRNCFCYPINNGGWVVRRYTLGVEESPSWKQDGNGYTRCYFNVEPDLELAARAKGGIEDTDRAFVFPEAIVAVEVASTLGATITLPNTAMGRQTRMKEHKDGRLIVEVKKEETDNGGEYQGWLPKNKKWVRIFDVEARRKLEPEGENFDDTLRHLITESNTNFGFVVDVEGKWIIEPLNNVKLTLLAAGYSESKAKQIIGACVKRPFTIVNRPFQPEYLGNRIWNRDAAQLKYKPTTRDNLNYPTWKIILNHCGSGLNDAIKENNWCVNNGIVSGADYLKCWCASILQNPTESLPYLFFWGPENSGKSIFHEAFKLLLTSGYTRADQALINPQGFNAELEHAVLCAVEETDLRQNKQAVNRIKDWVTGIDLSIHKKGQTPFHTANCTHWCQFSNIVEACPVNFGDTRITMLYVKPLEKIIPKRVLIQKLIKEAPDFIAELLNIDLPESDDRLGIKVISTVEKDIITEESDNPIINFLQDSTSVAPGYLVSIETLFGHFIKETMTEGYPKRRFIKEIVSTRKYPKGRINKEIAKMTGGETGHWYIGNITISKEPIEHRPPFRLQGEYLVSDWPGPQEGSR